MRRKIIDSSIFFMIALQVVLIALNAIFACAEIAVISLNDSKLSKLVSEGDKRAIRLEKLTSEPSRFLATIQVAITLSGFLGSAFAAENFSDVLVDLIMKTGIPISAKALDSISVVFITIVLSYFTLVFGELVPKQVAMRKAESLALGMSKLITGISKIFAPLVSLLTFSTNAILRLLGIDPNAKKDEVSEEEILMMVDVGSEKGTIDNDERDFIQNVFAFDNLTVEEIITHRTDVTLLYEKDSVDDWQKTIDETQYTYYPICDETPDNITGVLNTKLYFRLKDKSKINVLQNAVTQAYFVPETIKADVLFKNMKNQHIQFAVVMDEYGGMSGIITIKDLIEELVGDFDDGSQNSEDDDIAEEIDSNVWNVSGGISLEKLSSLLGVSFPSDEFETLNGLICHTLGCLPEIDTDVDICGLHICVKDVQNNQVKTVIIRKDK